MAGKFAFPGLGPWEPREGRRSVIRYPSCTPFRGLPVGVVPRETGATLPVCVQVSFAHHLSFSQCHCNSSCLCSWGNVQLVSVNTFISGNASKKNQERKGCICLLREGPLEQHPRWLISRVRPSISRLVLVHGTSDGLCCLLNVGVSACGMTSAPSPAFRFL